MKKALMTAILTALPALAVYAQESGSAVSDDNMGTRTQINGSPADTSQRRNQDDCKETGWGIFKRSDCPNTASEISTTEGNSTGNRMDATGSSSDSDASPRTGPGSSAY